VMIDGGLPHPELQYEIVDGNGELRRLDFAWPEFRVAVEYDGVDWHNDPEAVRNDRRRRLALQDVGWTVISMTFEDVRRRAWDFVARVRRELNEAQAA
jgi:very-short-patch-repair endonuclease